MAKCTKERHEIKPFLTSRVRFPIFLAHFMPVLSQDERLNTPISISSPHRFIWWLLRSIFLAVVLFALLSALFPLPPAKPYSLVVEDRNGQLLQAFLADDGMWRLPTSPEEIPDRLKKILVAREDRWFQYHPGVNPFSLVRALVQNLRTGRRVSGGSTITMQIARMMEPKERTYLHKAFEVFRALQLEARYSKKELLEIYLSIVPLGGNLEGLKSAALMYYQTPLERLNIAQLFDLILIPSNPNLYGPERNHLTLQQHRMRQASAWFAAGLLTAQDSAIIWSTPAAMDRKPLPRYAPHFCLRVREKYRGKSELRSSLDRAIQMQVERLLSNHLRPWRQRGVQNGAVMVIDNATKEVVAYAGSEDFGDDNAQGQVDAVKALRSPGSTLKPFLYALQMERGELTPRTRLLDTPYDAEGFLAENYDGTYSGLVYADEALQRSLNVPMIRMLKKAGVSSFLNFTGLCGIASLQTQRSRLGLSLILGGCGVTLEEMTAAYSIFPSGGVFVPPIFLKSAAGAAPEGREVFSSSTAYMVTEILSGLNRPDLPNNFASSLNLPIVAFKTGTSYGRRDAWCLGYSADYTVGVWIGNVTQRGSADLIGSKSAAPLLIDIFNSISRQHQKSILPCPRDVGVRMVCAKSGLLPADKCAHTIEDLYSVSRTTERLCNVCKQYFVSEDGTSTYCFSCLGDAHYRTMVFDDFPPELLAFWRKTGQPFVSAPPHNPRCVRVFSGEGPAIVSPSENMTYFLFSGRQKLCFQASSGVDVNEQIWYLNDEYLGRRKAGEQFFISLGNGDHTVTCMDDRGRTSSVHITVKHVM